MWNTMSFTVLPRRLSLNGVEQAFDVKWEEEEYLKNGHKSMSIQTLLKMKPRVCRPRIPFVHDVGDDHVLDNHGP